MIKRDDSQSSSPSKHTLIEKDIITIGDRFRFARSLAPMSRTAFCKKHKLNYNTVQSWELSRSNSREGNVSKFCEALAKEGIFCTEDWLFEENGPPPILNSTESEGSYSPLLTARRLKNKSSELHLCLAQDEILFFLENSGANGLDALAIQVLDNAMQPEYEKGEYIGAIRMPLDQAYCLSQTICLIETTPHHYLIRQLLVEGDKFILIPSNKAFPVLSFDHLIGVAQIIWRRSIPTSFPI